LTISKGKRAEYIADSWLRNRKLNILSRNFHSRWGEIDIIGIDKSTLCFIEVKYRESSHYGTAAETVTFKKQQRIIKTAQIYLHQNDEHIDKAARFDVVSLTGELDNPVIDWHKNAFMMST